MILGVSAEQDELRASVRRFLADRAPISTVRELMETTDGLDAGVWRQAGEQLGLQGIAIPEEYGGAGFSFAEQAIVLEELGAALYGGPYLASAVFAAAALLASPDEDARKAYLPGIASGEVIATLAFTEEDGSWDPDAIRLAASRDSDSGNWRLDGRKSFVLDGHTAGLILVVARTGDDLSLFAVPADAVQAGSGGLTRTALPTLDQTRKLARLDFAAVPATLIGSAGDGKAVLTHTLDVAAVAQAAEQLGGAQRALDMAVEYAKVRHQFDPRRHRLHLGTRCASVLQACEGQRAVPRRR
jgi:alkylation response protein AidB-like acyl-CoA dehydrogenase